MQQSIKSVLHLGQDQLNFDCFRYNRIIKTITNND
jgi:hypothetical protein